VNLREQFGGEWYEILLPIVKTEYFVKLGKSIRPNQFNSRTVYPVPDDVFKAFRKCPLGKLKVVILGQDPYHDGNATGLAFSNRDLLCISPSLRNIFKEVENDCYDGLKLDQDPNLERWAEQGVLLLNTALTVETGRPGVHAELWKPFTQFVLESISKECPAIVYLLWGAHAKGYLEHISKESNFILTSPHPSPFSANKGFFGNEHFSKTNEILTEVGISLGVDNYDIEW